MSEAAIQSLELEEVKVECPPQEKAEEDTDKRCTLFDNFKTWHDREREEEESREQDSRPEKKHVAKKEDSFIHADGSYLHDMLHEEDPKELLLKKLGDLSSIRLSGAQVLVATYIRPEKKKSGLILTTNMREEDKFQGKCGLAVKMGPLAYVETDKMNFGGYKANVGDWVWYRPVDGYALSVNGVHCRVLDDVEIKGDLDNPDVIL